MHGSAAVEPVLLNTDNRGFHSWMYVEQEQCDVIRYLDSLAQEGRISWCEEEVAAGLRKARQKRND